MTKKSAAERDGIYIERARRRALRAYQRLGTVRKVGAEWGVNHGWVSALLRHGSVPKSDDLRVKLGLPTVLPTERERRKQATMEMWTIEQYRAYMDKNGGKKSKYRNVKTEVDGIVFASGHEALRYGELKMLEQAGEIDELSLQVPFRLDVDGVHICNYVADFVYRDKQGRQVVEDAKGMRTEKYQLKKKLMLACHQIEILET